MSIRNVFGFALGASLLFGLQQIAVAAPIEESQSPAETPTATQDKVAEATYTTRRATGNVYGAHGVIGSVPKSNVYGSRGPVARTHAARRGYYGAVGRRSYAHRYYEPRPVVTGGYYGAAGYRPYNYASAYSPTPPIFSLGDYGAESYRTRYYSQGSYPTRAVPSSEYYRAAGYRPYDYAPAYSSPRPILGDSGADAYSARYYTRRYYPTRPVASEYYATAGYRPSYYEQGYYPSRSVAATGAPVFYNDPISAISGR